MKINAAFNNELSTDEVKRHFEMAQSMPLEEFNSFVASFAERLSEEQSRQFSFLKVDKLRAREREARFSGVPQDAYLWMALLPDWTIELIEACNLPVGSSGAAATMKHLQDAGLIQVCNAGWSAPKIMASEAINTSSVAEWTGWTGSDAVGCLSAATEMTSVDETVDDAQAEQLRLLEQLAPSPPTSTGDLKAQSYTMTQAARADVLEEYLAPENHEGIQFVRRTLADLGRRITTVMESLSTISPRLRRWAVLAREADTPSEMVMAFDYLIERELAVKNPAEALKWMESAYDFAALMARDLNTSMNVALQRASRRLELLHRREHDRQMLRYMLERDELTQAFNELMDGPNDLWALHFIGVGGVGKTMLMRHITVDLAPAHDAISARIDFDYLNADYPTLAPGLLLSSFAEELRAYDTGARNAGQATARFDKADKLLLQLRDRLRTDSAATRPEQRATSDPLFIDAVGLYCEALRLLPKPVVLIVDTCEELAKVRPDGTVPKNVEETFRILRALHDGSHVLAEDDSDVASSVSSTTSSTVTPLSDRVANLRVIFSGRRPLAKSGYGWRCPTSPHQARPYLRLHEVRGFTHPEADRFLRDIMEVPEELRSAIIRNAPEVPSALKIEWIGTDREETPSGEEVTSQDAERALEGVGIDAALTARADNHPANVPRCNPYELKLYAEWAKEEPPPKPETIATASSAQYIELRIVRRLDFEPLERLLPTLALLGHIDREMLRHITDADSTTRETIFEKLRQQEWTEQRLVVASDGSRQNVILDIEPKLRARLLSYYKAHGRGGSDVQRRAADYLEELTLRSDLGALDWSVFDAALRVLETDARPERVAEWWQAIEQRIVAERGYAWLREVTDPMQASDGAVAAHERDAVVDTATATAGAPTESRMRAAVLATHAAALLHTNHPGEALGVWREVALKAARHPEPSEIARLQQRALATSIALTQLTNEKLRPEDAANLFGAITQHDATTLDAELAASFVAALEGVIEYQERLAADSLAGGLLAFVSDSDSQQRTIFFAPQHLAETIKQARERWQQERPELTSPLHELTAFAESLTARALLLAGEHKAALRCFQQSLASLPAQPASSVPVSTARAHVWADWLMPDDMFARLRLEFMRSVYPALLPVHEVEDAVRSWNIDLHGMAATVDGERLQSAILAMRLGQQVVRTSLPQGALDSTTGEVVYKRSDLVPGAIRCNAHRWTPPFFTIVAKALAGAGRIDEALPVLRYVSAQAMQFDLDTVRHAERTLTQVVRRMRLREVGEKGGMSLADSPSISDRALLWSLDALDGDKHSGSLPNPDAQLQDAPSRQAWLHAVWRTCYALSDERARVALEWADAHLADHALKLANASNESSDFSAVSICFDANEALRLSSNTPAQPQLRSLVAVNAIVEFDPEAWWLAHPHKPQAALRLWLRATALGYTHKRVEDEESNSPAQHLGWRWAATMALEEGEMLALRLPQFATSIFDTAAVFFEKVNDAAGMLFAHTLSALYSDAESSAPSSRLRTSMERAYRQLHSEISLPTSQTASSASTSSTVSDAPTSSEQRQQTLPSWEQLENIAATGSHDELNAVTPLVWRPWLVRVLLCLARPAGSQTSATRERLLRLRQWLIETSGSRRGLLPAELAAWAKGAGVAITPEPRTADPSPMSKSVGRWLLLVGYISLAVMLVIGFLLFRFAASWLVPEIRVDVGLLGQVGAYLAALVIFSVVLAITFRRAASLSKGQATDTFSLWRAVVLPLGIMLTGLFCAGTFIHINVLRIPTSTTTPSPPQSIGIPVIIGVVLVVAGGVLLCIGVMRSAIVLVRRLRSKWLSLSTLTLQVDVFLTKTLNRYTALTEVPPVGITMTRWSPGIRWQTLTLIYQRWKQEKYVTLRQIFSMMRVSEGAPGNRIEVPRLASYPQLAELLPDEMAQRLKRIINMLGNRRMGVVIETQQGTHGPCWEAMIALSAFSLIKGEDDAADNSDLFVQLPFRFRRCPPGISVRSLKETSEARVVSLASSTVAIGTAQRGWAPLREVDFFSWSANQSGEVLNAPLNSPDNVRVLHLIGNVEETNAGARFRLASDTSGGAEQSVTKHPSATHEEADPRYNQLLRAEDLGRSYPNLALCVVQGKPDAGDNVRLEGDRREAMLMRVWAAELFAQGVPAVIVIPSLDPALAVAVLEQLARVVSWRAHRGTWALMEVLAKMQRTIAKGSQGYMTAQMETALDACLYVVEDFDARLG